MKVEDVFKLLDAGFTKADIEKMLSGDDAGKGDTPDDGKSDPVDEEKGKQEEEKKNEPNDAYSALMETVKDLKSTVEAMQKANIDNANKPKEESRTVEDLVADFTKDM